MGSLRHLQGNPHPSHSPAPLPSSSPASAAPEPHVLHRTLLDACLGNVTSSLPCFMVSLASRAHRLLQNSDKGSGAQPSGGRGGKGGADRPPGPRSAHTHFQDHLLRRSQAAQGIGAETAGTRPATCWPPGQPGQEAWLAFPLQLPAWLGGRGAGL